MRNNQEKDHTPGDVLFETYNCCIFNIDLYDDELEDEMSQNEVMIYNDYTYDDPLILTIDELEMLGKQIMELAKEARDKNR